MKSRTITNYLLILLFIFLFIPNLIRAQQKTRTEILTEKRQEKAKNLQAYKPSTLERLLLFVEHNPFEEILTNGILGFRPVVGGLKSGSGIGGGIRFEPTQHLDQYHFELKATASFKSYQDYEASLGYEHSKLSIFNYAQYRDSPQDNFYGVGSNSDRDNRTNFRLKDIKVGGIFAFRPFESFSLTIQETYLKNEVGSGISEDYPTINEQFEKDVVPGLIDEKTEFYISSAGVVFDFRGVEYTKYLTLKQALLDDPLDLRGANPFRGTYISLKASRYENRSSDLFDFNRYEFELQQYFPCYKGHRVIAFRSFVSIVNKNDGADVPFYLMQPIGGSMSVRGYQEFRYRDRNAILFNVEYRWYVWSGLDMALFWDAGNVFSHHEHMTLKAMKNSYGIGFHFNSKTSLPLRIDLAHGKEGFHFIIKFSNIF